MSARIIDWEKRAKQCKKNYDEMVDIFDAERTCRDQEIEKNQTEITHLKLEVDYLKQLNDALRHIIKVYQAITK